jgi:Flp pilus assembly pilin Flp
MRIVIQQLKSFAQDQSGAVAIEYALIAGAMCLGLVATFPLFANAIKDKLFSVAGYFSLV